jgi:hypothetical protein
MNCIKMKATFGYIFVYFHARRALDRITGEMPCRLHQDTQVFFPNYVIYLTVALGSPAKRAIA